MNKANIKAFLGIVVCALLILIFLSPDKSMAFSFPVDATNFAILYEGNGGDNFNFNNATDSGNIGIGGTGAVQFSSGTINGLVEFSAGNSGQFHQSGGTLNPSSGNPTYNNANVALDLTNLNSLSKTLGLESGTAVTITGGGSLTASSGNLANGDRVFTGTVSSSFTANTTFTINGKASDFVVINIPASGNGNMNGQIVLAGGITSDHVLINFTPDPGNPTNYNNAYQKLSGGPTLQVAGNGGTTNGIYLDPTGTVNFDNMTLDGRLIGGDSSDFAFVSGANIVAPPPVPLPPSALMLGSGLLGLGLPGWRRRKN